MQHSMLATIIVPVKNAEAYLPEILVSIQSQSIVDQIEVLAIDSGSLDNSPEILRKYEVRVLQIPPENFNHGATRNLAAQQADPDSQFLVYLSQDALPHDENWLANLLSPLQADESVAGVFSRHIPRPGASPSLVRQLTTRWQTGGMERIVKEMPDDPQDYLANRDWYIYFSNTSSAIRKSVWEDIPFREVAFGEDADWADRVLQAGFKIVYEPSSVVIHSHDYSTIEQLRQNVDHTHAMIELFDPPVYHDRWLWLKMLISLPREVWWDIQFMRSSAYCANAGFYTKMRWVLHSPCWHLASLCGALIGANLERVPVIFRRFFMRQERIRVGDVEV